MQPASRLSSQAFHDDIKNPELCAARIVKIELSKFAPDESCGGGVSIFNNRETLVNQMPRAVIGVAKWILKLAARVVLEEKPTCAVKHASNSQSRSRMRLIVAAGDEQR
jgi:hypothetical protein